MEATNGRYGVPNSLAVGFCFPSFFLSDLVPPGCASLSQAVQVLTFLGKIFRHFFSSFFFVFLFFLFFSFFLLFFKGLETFVDTFQSFSQAAGVRKGTSRPGQARPGQARQGKARQGKARQGKASASFKKVRELLFISFSSG